MNFKLTIAAVALSASSAFALIGPGTQIKTICLGSSTDANGVQYAGNCDESANNKTLQKPLLPNGCAADQISVTAYGYQNKFNVEVTNCLPPNVAQL